jgi:DNA-directed RNA polymerase subunit RPC12/RpoP
MKARTAKERAVEAATEQYITNLGFGKVIRQAARPKHYVRIPLNYKERGVWCTNCGGRIDFNPDLLVNIYNTNEPPVLTCPHCGEKITRCRTIQRGIGHYLHRDYNIALKVEAHGPWQVLRYYYVEYEAIMGGEPKMGKPIEIVRRWYNIEHGGKPVVWSTGRVGSWYGCGFALDSELSLKHEDHHGGAYGYNNIHYRVCEDDVVPGAQWHRGLRRDGFKGASTKRLLGLPAFDIPVVFSCPQLVTLYKSHKWVLLRYYGAEASADLSKIKEDWPSIRVALRHGYRITDPGLWHDYLGQLRELGEDTLSPHWICPVNLPLAHDLTNSRIQRLRKAKDAERDKQLAAAAEEKYARKIAPFRDLRFSAAGVVIAVIPSVEDVRQEGEHMHHCVFSMKYYDKKTSLLLSARDTDGHRLETIEFNLSSGKVEQSRAVQNGISPKHNQILAMMKDAADQITEAWKRSKAQKPEITIKPVQELVRAFV